MEDESSPSPAAPEFFDTAGYYAVVDSKNADHFAVDDLLDFPNDDTLDAAASPPPPPSCNSSLSAAADPHFDIGAGSPAGHFSGELSVPYEELAELEWLSHFVEESFSSEGLHKLHLIQGTKARNDAASGPARPETVASGPTFRPEVPVPGKARSKRSRAAPGNWTSRLLAVAPTPASAPAVSSSSESDASAKKPGKLAGQRKREGHDGGGEGRKCLHCATDKTPQWRTGPMGPKTLCNACGVRYKSGRLVPEYRPAASPTFTLTKHSNSHRKVMELRRQKEMQRGPQLPPAAAAAPPPYLHHHLHQNVVFDVPNGDDYLIHHHVGPDYRQLT